MTTEPQTEQEWLGNSFAFRAEPRLFNLLDIGPRFPLVPERTGHLIEGPRIPGRLAPEPSAAALAAGEAALMAGMKRALKPFPVPAGVGWYGRYPRAGVRIRPDGRFQLRIWLDPSLPDPVHGGPCETLAEAVNLGALICSYSRAAE